MKQFLVFLLSFVHAFAFGQTTLRTDKVLIGKSGSTNKEIIFDQGSGGANPRFRFNQANGKIEFSTDGTTFYTFATPNGSELLQGKTLETLNLDSQSIPGAATIADLSSSKALAIITGSTLTNLTGISGGVAGKVITVLNATTGDLTIKHEDAGATAANRITLAGMTQLKVKINTAVDLVYTSSNRWVMKGGSGTGGGGSSGSSGFISNGAFEDGLTGWTCFKSTAAARPSDSMVFNTGQAVTLVADQTSPLNGTAHGKFTKDAVNRQGEGCYFDFSIPEAYKTKVLKVEGSHKVLTGTFTAGIGGTSPVDSDLIVYIYDRTNNKVIEPNNFRLLSNSTNLPEFLENMEFQATTSTQYRLMFYVASTSANAFEIALDDVDVVPVKKGSASLTSSGWKDFPSVAAGVLITATTTNPTYGNVVTNKAQYRYDGPDVEIMWSFRQTTGGTAGSGRYLFNIPPSICVIDVTKVKASPTFTGWGADMDSSVGTFNAGYSGGTSGVAQGFVTVYSSSQLKAQEQAQFNTGYDQDGWGSTHVQFGHGAMNFHINAKIPCVGRDSSVNRSSEDDMRVLVFDGYKSSNQSLTADVTKVTFTSDTDSHGSWSGDSFTAQMPGVYVFAMKGNTSAGNSFYVWVNGVKKAYLTNTYFSQNLSGLTVVSLKAGDVVDVRGSVNTNLIGDSASKLSATSLQIFRLSGPQSIAASETISASYFVSANHAASTSSPINFDSREDDSHGGLVTTGAAWKFSAPANGRYVITSLINVSGGSGVGFTIYKNGVAYKPFGWAGGAGGTANASGSIVLRQGDYIDIRPTAAATIVGGALNSSASIITITRVGI